MKKIPTMFIRNKENRAFVLDRISPGCEWVQEGKGIATRKYDGTCCMVKNFELFKRRTVKQNKISPPNFRCVDVDPLTGTRIGWVPVTREDKYHMEALSNLNPMDRLKNETHELLGPKIQGNPEHSEKHRLFPHSIAETYPDCPRDFNGIREFFKGKNIEGIVWRLPDGRMCKIKKKDFGMERS
ncbi:MAG TPA: hypothetical protein ENI76_05820 [Ignavibacteria bacterium]|nr:hypothetical protein [Ignavibacteria bacterium]